MAQEYSTPPAYTPEPQRRSNTTRIVIIVLLVILCCVCSTVLILYFWLGDLIIQWLTDWGFITTLQLMPLLA